MGFDTGAMGLGAGDVTGDGLGTKSGLGAAAWITTGAGAGAGL